MLELNNSLENDLINSYLNKISELILSEEFNIEEFQKKLDESINWIIKKEELKNSQKAEIIESIWDLLINYWNIENWFNLYNKVSQITENIEKETELYNKKITYYLAYYDYNKENGDLFKEIKNETKEKIKLSIENKNKQKKWEYLFNLYLLKEKTEKQKAKNILKSSALNFYEPAIDLYLEDLENNFFNEYDKIKDKNKKNDFRFKYLDDLIEKHLYFIENIENFSDRSIYWYYWNIWDIYKRLWNYSYALDYYLKWVENWIYNLYWAIWDLYAEDKVKLLTLKNTNSEQAYRYYKKYYERSLLNSDYESVVYALEKTWDLKIKENFKDEAEEFYTEAISFTITKNTKTSDTERLLFKAIDCTENHNKKIDLLYKLWSINYKNWWLICEYLDEMWNYEEAFWNYIQLINYSKEINQYNDNIKNQFIIFLETTIKDIIKSNKNKYLNDLMEIEELNWSEIEDKYYWLDLILYDTQIEGINIIIKDFEKTDELSIEAIENIYEIIYWDNLNEYVFMYNKVFSTYNDYLNWNFEINNANLLIFLLKIIFWNKSENQNLKTNKIIEKIIKLEALNSEDIEIIKIAINFLKI